MKALGMIETIGMVGAIEALDTALKTADVDVLNRHIVKGGIVTVEIVGDVGAIKVAVEAGAEAAKKLGVFVGSHVIARPDEMVFQMIEKDSIVHQQQDTEKPVDDKTGKEDQKPEVKEEVKKEVKEEKPVKSPVVADKENKPVKVEAPKEPAKPVKEVEKPKEPVKETGKGQEVSKEQKDKTDKVEKNNKPKKK